MKTKVLLSRPAAWALVAVSSFLSTGVLCAQSKSLRAGVPAPAPVEERAGVSRPELKEVTYLGISTHSIDATLASQMELPPETGLVVVHILPDSPAADVLKKHDLLTRFEDQILIEPRQLGVLVRSRKEGEEVKLTLFRGGKQQTVSVKLGKKAMPPLPEGFTPGMRRTMTFEGAPAALFSRPAKIRSHVGREPAGEMRVSSFGAEGAVMVFNDGDGRLELNFKDGKKRLTAWDKQGKQVFSGPVDTEDERKALPADIRARLEKMETTDVRVPAPPFPPEPPADHLRSEPRVFAPGRPAEGKMIVPGPERLAVPVTGVALDEESA
jgi:serine protease Do